MKFHRVLTPICTVVLILTMMICLAACSDLGELASKLDPFGNIETYYWYDADGTLLHKDTVGFNATPQEYPLPEDSDQWDYIEWREGETPAEQIAYRMPQTSYFVGNVFQIIVQDLGEQPIGTGSAFVFNSDGWFVTNAHVMEDAYYAEAIFNIPNSATGESFTYFDINEGTYYHLDKDIYIGQIANYSSIQSYYKEIPINTEYEIGETTYSVGYPLSSTDLIINDGEITESWSDLYEKLYSGNSYICSSSAIAPGSSGGILTNDNLEVIGITTLGWFDEYDEFISGASISAFNFQPLLQNTNARDSISLQERFHSNEKVFIEYFNAAKEAYANGEAEIYYFEDGSLSYVFEWTNEGVNDDGLAGSYVEKLLIRPDGWMSHHLENYWESGDRRSSSFYGYYDHKKGFANFHYEFAYHWSDGSYFTVTCNNINYSPTLSLTLNQCVVDAYKCTVGEAEINYAKEHFNSIYEGLTEDMTN